VSFVSFVAFVVQQRNDGEVPKMSLSQIVGEKTYTVWVDMLRRLVPDGRTHRLAPMIASMLQYTAEVAYERYSGNPPEGSLAYTLLKASEMYDPDQALALLSDAMECLFEDAGMGYERVSSRGDEYSVADAAALSKLHPSTTTEVHYARPYRKNVRRLPYC
jgi:hypothetical protein